MAKKMRVLADATFRGEHDLRAGMQGAMLDRDEVYIDLPCGEDPRFGDRITLDGIKLSVTRGYLDYRSGDIEETQQRFQHVDAMGLAGPAS